MALCSNSGDCLQCRFIPHVLLQPPQFVHILTGSNRVIPFKQSHSISPSPPQRSIKEREQLKSFGANTAIKSRLSLLNLTAFEHNQSSATETTRVALQSYSLHFPGIREQAEQPRSAEQFLHLIDEGKT